MGQRSNRGFSFEIKATILFCFYLHRQIYSYGKSYLWICTFIFIDINFPWNKWLNRHLPTKALSFPTKIQSYKQSIYIWNLAQWQGTYRAFSRWADSLLGRWAGLKCPLRTSQWNWITQSNVLTLPGRPLSYLRCTLKKMFGVEEVARKWSWKAEREHWKKLIWDAAKCVRLTDMLASVWLWL